jgi:protein tyrosine/serine phosphatase
MIVPFERSYWVEPGIFLAGCYPGAKRFDEEARKLTGLLDAGIRCIINLMEERETDWQGAILEPYEENIQILAEDKGLDVECVRIPVMDTSIPPITTMTRILDEIDSAIDRERPVYVHCWGGKGRTGTVVGCWLARHGKATGDQALAVIQELRKNDPTRYEPSPENETQRQMVREWKRGQ